MPLSRFMTYVVSCAFFAAAPPTLLAQSALIPNVSASHETMATKSPGDAADDPAIWVDPSGFAHQILTTDKHAGVLVYDLKNGAEKQFLAIGRVNNIDLRQGLRFYKDGPREDIAAATMPDRGAIALFDIDRETGDVSHIWNAKVSKSKPYGLCVGKMAARDKDGGLSHENSLGIFVTYHDGFVEYYRFEYLDDRTRFMSVGKKLIKFGSALEGCVYDEAQGILFVGEEDDGIWAVTLANEKVAAAIKIDSVGSDTGLAADIEGLSIWRQDDLTGYLVASSQGSHQFYAYERTSPFAYKGRFTIGGVSGASDPLTHTDGIAISSSISTDAFPKGVMVAQDDENSDPVAHQNFKVINWADIEKVLPPAQD